MFGTRASRRLPILVIVGAMAPILLTAGAVEGRVRPGTEVTRLRTVSVANGARSGGTAKCPSGDRAIAGGAYWHRPNQNGDPSLGAWITASAPTIDARGWYAAGLNAANETLRLTVTVQCLPSASFPAYTVRQRDLIVDFNRSGEADLRCPAGQKVVMGGGFWHEAGKAPSPQLSGQITGSAPDMDGFGWSTEGWARAMPPLRYKVTAFCLPVKALGADYVVRLNLNPPADEDYFECPSGSFVLGGGAFWSYTDSTLFDPSLDARGFIRGLSATGYGTALYVSGWQNQIQNVGLVEAEVCIKA